MKSTKLITNNYGKGQFHALLKQFKNDPSQERPKPEIIINQNK